MCIVWRRAGKEFKCRHMLITATCAVWPRSVVLTILLPSCVVPVGSKWLVETET